MSLKRRKLMLSAVICYITLSLPIFTRVDAQDSKQVSEEFDLRNDVTGNESERDFYPQPKDSELCRECSCPRAPQCEPGVSLVIDGCGCCKVCARQLGQECDQKNVCDSHRGLICDTNTGRCKARPGRPCYVGNKWRENGELFSPSCRITCSCIDGDIGCISKCKPPPAGCANPRLVRSSDNCCGAWRCRGRESPKSLSGSQTSVTFRGSCMIQTTEWSRCSETCGFGLSERVTNDNENCKLTKETRLCIVRQCEQTTTSKKSKRSCRRVTRHSKRVQFSLSGCLSTKTYKPRYCGTCRHPGKCCKPKETKTIEMSFKCDSPSVLTKDKSVPTEFVIKRKFMWIQSCVCGDYCPTSENDIFSNSFHGLQGDTWRPI